MSRDQRAHDNHALLAAQRHAQQSSLPLIVAFNCLPQPGVRAREHVTFMIEGLREVQTTLLAHNIPFLMTYGHPAQELGHLFTVLRPHAVYYDFNPLPAVRAQQKTLASTYNASHSVVDTHNIIPCFVASDKQEFAAHTFRRKIVRLLESFLVEPPQLQKQTALPKAAVKSLTFHEIEKLTANLPQRGMSIAAQSGEAAARRHLDAFITNRLDRYAQERNNIAHDLQSGLSPYLHFGQLSSLRVALEVLYHTSERPLLFDRAQMPQPHDEASASDGMNALFEEMIVRKELSDNFCLHAAHPFSLESAPNWARASLDKHRADVRQFTYSRPQWEAAKTHDPAWNAAQNQLRRTGKIHGYMRMYWAKKMLEWSASPEEALADCLYLNDAYSIDGGDPNGYVGALWSIAGLHDRPWNERPVFGQIRYMNSAGLKRKFDLDSYIKQWS